MKTSLEFKIIFLDIIINYQLFRTLTITKLLIKKKIDKGKREREREREKSIYLCVCVCVFFGEGEYIFVFETVQ